MKTNNLLTILLYALLAALTVAAFFQCNKLQKQKAADERDRAAYEKTLNDYSAAQDSAAGSSSFTPGTSESTADAGTVTVSKDGIEEDGNVVKTAPKVATTAKTAKPAVASKTAQPKKLTAKGGSSGRYLVRAGAFKYVDNARTRLEEVIKLGFQSAEIAKMPTQKGVLAFVIAKRTNNKSEAQRIMDLLEDKGIDADVVDTAKK
jgi:cell division septation protein DedD